MPPVSRDSRSVAPPHDLDAERAALGALLYGDEASREAATKAMSSVQARDFYKAGHQLIYAAIYELFEKNEKVDIITVAEQLRRHEQLDAAGGKTYVSALLDDLPLVANIQEYLDIIAAKASMRRVMEIGHLLFDRALQDRVDVEELVQAASQHLYEISIARTRGGLQRLNKLVLPEIELIEELSKQAGGEEGFITGLPTGFHWLDQMTSGLQRGELVVVAARPGMGKTSFALNIAEHVANTKKVPIMLFSVEMSAHDIVLRLLCAHGHVNSHDVRRGKLYPEDRHRLHNAAGVLHELPVWIDESSRLTPLEIRSRARKILGEARATHGLVIVDYMQLLDVSMDITGSRPENRQQEITAISRSLKSVAKELNLPVLVLSQLSRAPERREGQSRRPRLSDLRESGAIEQDADVVIFIYQDQRDQPAEGENQNRDLVTARVAIAKNRNGPTGTFPLEFNKAWTRFFHQEHFQLLPEDE